jgi:hypothetical protein
MTQNEAERMERQVRHAGWNGVLTDCRVEHKQLVQGVRMGMESMDVKCVQKGIKGYNYTGKISSQRKKLSTNSLGAEWCRVRS